MTSTSQSAKAVIDLRSFSDLEWIESDGSLLDLLADSFKKLPQVPESQDGNKKLLLEVFPPLLSSRVKCHFPPVLSSWKVFPNWSSSNMLSPWAHPADHQLAKLIRSAILPATFRSVGLFKRNASEGAIKRTVISDEASR